MAGPSTDPWQVWKGATRLGGARRRLTAMNLVDRPYIPGRIELRNTRTGERWERRGGTWIKTQPSNR